jgi:hypothetical protein
MDIKIQGKTCEDCKEKFFASKTHFTRCKSCQNVWYTKTFDTSKTCMNGCGKKGIRKGENYCEYCSTQPEKECIFCHNTFLSEEEILCFKCLHLVNNNTFQQNSQFGRLSSQPGRLLCRGTSQVDVTYKLRSKDGSETSIKSVTVRTNIKAGFRAEHFDEQGVLKNPNHPSLKYYLGEYFTICVLPFQIYGDPVDPTIYMIPQSVQLVNPTQ